MIKLFVGIGIVIILWIIFNIDVERTKEEYEKAFEDTFGGKK